MNRARIIPIMFALAILFAGCNNSSNNSNAKTQTEGEKGSEMMHGAMYKRYSGTIGDMHVVANISFLQPGSSSVSVGGNYYYVGKSSQIDLQQKDKKDSVIQLEEYVLVTPTHDDNMGAQWYVTINERGIKGTWKSADGQKSYAIDLRENYDEGSYPFDVIYRKDSAVIAKRDNEYGYFLEFQLLNPGKNMKREDAAVLTKEMMHFLGGDTMGAKNIDEYISAFIKNEKKQYTDWLTEETKDADLPGEGERGNWDFGMSSFCDYNGNGIVVLEFDMTGYSGGAHPNSWSKFLTVDVRAGKVLMLDDMLKVDSVKLARLLEQAARSIFKIKEGEPLNNTLLVDTIPPTDNVIISDRGLTFHYNAYEVTPYVMGDVFIYLPYAKLEDMLKPEFRKRMKL